YITAQQRIAFPGSSIANSLDGGGALRTIAGTTPGAGAEVSETVPTGARWELISFKVTFVTSAAVANRQPQLLIDDGTNVIYQYGTTGNQTATQTFRRMWFPGGPVPTADINNNVPFALPIGIRLSSGYRMRTSTPGIDVADQYSAVVYLVREWMEGA